MRTEVLEIIRASVDGHLKRKICKVPYGLDMIESCIMCNLRSRCSICNISNSSLQVFERITYAAAYPKGAVLFVEGQAPRGIFVLCKGRAKLSTNSRHGKTLILRIADAGDVLGLSATIGGRAYEVTAETIEPCQVNFVGRGDFLLYLRERVDACLRVVEHLGERYINICRELRCLGVARSAAEKLARLVLDLASQNEVAEQEPQVRLALTHDEIAQMIGTSRETVTRVFAQLKKRRIVQFKGSILFIRNMAALNLIGGNSTHRPTVKNILNLR